MSQIVRIARLNHVETVRRVEKEIIWTVIPWDEARSCWDVRKIHDHRASVTFGNRDKCEKRQC